MLYFLLFAGTTEGRKLAEYLAGINKVSVTVCVATEYGQTLLPSAENIEINTSRMDETEMIHLIKSKSYSLVIDATHPYADKVSQNIVSACGKTNLAYLRIIRKSAVEDDSSTLFFSSAEEAVNYLQTTTGNILTAAGSKELPAFLALHDYKERVFARIIPSIEALQICLNLGFTGKQLICMQGPFTEELNIALLKQYQIKYLITKESGKAGGFEEKIRAAKKACVTPIVIKRPCNESGLTYEETVLTLHRCYQLPHPHKKRTIILVGIGMGAEHTITQEAKEALLQCDIILGADRIIRSLSGFTKPKTVLYMPDDIKSYLDTHLEYNTAAVAFSGDTGFYSGAHNCFETLKNDYNVHILPGISTPSYFCAKLGISYEDVFFTSLHGRSADLLQTIKTHKKTFCLFGTEPSVKEICSKLKNEGLGNIQVFIGESLSYPEEKISIGLAEEFVSLKTFPLCAALFVNENVQNNMLPVTFGLPDSSFIRSSVPMTKQEIRTLILSKLMLGQSSVLYDVGAGTGSISIEAARLLNTGHVYAIERNPEGVDLIKSNRKNFNLQNISVILGNAPDSLKELPVPTHVFLGGTGGNLKEIIAVLLEKNPKVRIVMTAISMETISEAMELSASCSIASPDIIQVSIAKAKKAGNHHMMLAQNPIFIFSWNGTLNDNTMKRSET